MIDQLKTLLANHIEASLTVQGYHWNVEGINFNEYHDFFVTVYNLYYSQIDRLAEHVRIVSKGTEYVIATVDVVKANKTIKPAVIVGANTLQMITAIDSINEVLLVGFGELFKTASKNNEQGLADYTATQVDELNKLAWKLKAIKK